MKMQYGRTTINEVDENYRKIMEQKRNELMFN